MFYNKHVHMGIIRFWLLASAQNFISPLIKSVPDVLYCSYLDVVGRKDHLWLVLLQSTGTPEYLPLSL